MEAGKAERKRAADAGAAHWSRSLLRMQQMVDRAGGNLQDVMDTVVASAMDLIPHATGAVVELRDGDELVYRAGSGTAAALRGFRIRAEGSLSGQAVLQGAPLICHDAGTDERVDRAACDRLGLRSMILVPLPHHGVFVGALKIYSDQAHAFGDRDILTAHLLAGPLAVGFANVTEAVAVAERAIAHRRFTATFEQAAVGIAHVSPEGEFLLVNDKFCAIIGYSREEALALTFQQITHPDDLDADLGYVKSLLAGTIGNYSMEKRYLRADGGELWINLTVSLVRDDAGAPDFFVAVVEDINARKRAELESNHDPLTGLLNRRGTLSRLERELGRSALSGEPMVVAFVDLDGFKAVNDQFGHAAGDRCLTRIAAALVEASRPGDVVGRLGGDEFLVLLPTLRAAAAPGVLQRLLDAVGDLELDGGCRVRASIGALAVPGGAAIMADDAVARADRLMYRAKAAGKDRYVLQSLPAPHRAALDAA